MARKILLADDSVTAQNMGRKILADAGYEVITVNNGSAALKKIAELKPDLVILDVYMPGYSGLEVCQRLKESQESARIPVLLTVGKLEPFKPEEAQRVRAEGFIVKPFEASELLSALSKLEDKVVPRAEPSKPGRFARAIALAEEAGRISRNDAGSDDDGWKSRIGFPRQKTPQEQAAGDAPIYNPVNRDLRTIVESPARPAENKENQQQETAETVDVAALAPPGLPQNVMPQDVTPEEVAAIAAAAAQIQMAAAMKDEQQLIAVEDSAVPAAERMDVADSSSGIQASSAPAVSTPAVHPEGRTESVVGKDEGAAYKAGAAETELPRDLEENSQEPQDLPVTMAAATESIGAGNETASRWTAVSVALEADEATMSLEQEMQKAYSAFVAEETASSSSTAVHDMAPRDSASTACEGAQETQLNAISNFESQSAQQVRCVENADASPVEPGRAELSLDESSTAESKPAESEPGLQSDVAAVASIDAAPASATETTTDSIQQRDSAIIETGQPASVEAEPAPSSSVSEPFREPVAEFPDTRLAAAAVPQELASAAESEAAMSEPPAPSGDSLAIVQNQSGENPQEESETVKSTAAAWASWRQIRDSSDPNPETAEPARDEVNVSEPARAESAAMAVAAGAEQNGQESAAPPAENPTDVASIVDSVLADLRPRLMAEITRKMAEKK